MEGIFVVFAGIKQTNFQTSTSNWGYDFLRKSNWFHHKSILKRSSQVARGLNFLIKIRSRPDFIDFEFLEEQVWFRQAGNRFRCFFAVWKSRVRNYPYELEKTVHTLVDKRRKDWQFCYIKNIGPILCRFKVCSTEKLK